MILKQRRALRAFRRKEDRLASTGRQIKEREKNEKKNLKVQFLLFIRMHIIIYNYSISFA